MGVTVCHALHWARVQPADRVRERLVATGVSAKELARATGLKSGTARLVLRGKRRLHAKHFPNVAGLLGLDDVAELLSAENGKARQPEERELVDIYRALEGRPNGQHLLMEMARTIAKGDNLLGQLSGEVIQKPLDDPTIRGRQGEIEVGDVSSIARQSLPRRRKRARRKGNE